MEHGILGDAGIVDQYIDRAEIGLDLSNTGLAGVIVRDIPLVGLDAGFLGECGCRLVIASVGCSNTVSRVFQCNRNRRANTARTARNQSHTCHKFLPY